MARPSRDDRRGWAPRARWAGRAYHGLWRGRVLRPDTAALPRGGFGQCRISLGFASHPNRGTGTQTPRVHARTRERRHLHVRTHSTHTQHSHPHMRNAGEHAYSTFVVRNPATLTRAAITVFQNQVPNSKSRAVIHFEELPPEQQTNYCPSVSGLVHGAAERRGA